MFGNLKKNSFLEELLKTDLWCFVKQKIGEMFLTF